MIHLVHGFNDPSPEATFAGLAGSLAAAGIESRILDYGHRITLLTDKPVAAILEHVRPGDSIIAHSNGAVAACVAALEHGVYIRHLIAVQPPLDPGFRFPPTISRVSVIWNRGDRVVDLSGNFNRVIHTAMPWRPRARQYYGAMGRVGPSDSRVESVEISREYGHSGAFRCPVGRAGIVGLVV
jgi:pimeloyl-ACP methyl ester carboxylesterase